MIRDTKVTLLLASQSPRRRALLKEIGFPVKIVAAPDIDEVFPDTLKGAEIPSFIASEKAKAYKELLKNDEVLVTADTIVWLEEKVLGKPDGREGAIKMLTELSGKVHQVFTGVCLTYQGKQVVFYDETKVYFKKLSLEEITFYVNTHKPFDKAGAYGVQEWIGFIGVERIEGSYFNVMGLPVHRLYEEINQIID